MSKKAFNLSGNLFCSFLLTIFCLVIAAPSLHGQAGSAIYDRIGIIPEHGLHGAVP